MNIVVATKRSTADLGGKILDEIAKQSCVRSYKIFRLEEDADDRARRMIAEHEVDYFIDLVGRPDLLELKKINPEKHTFFIGFKDGYSAGEDELFEAGFRVLQESRVNLLIGRNVLNGEDCGYMIIYPEKTYVFFSAEGDFVRQLVEDFLKRENTSHSRSIQIGKFAGMPKEVYAKFYSTGRELFEKGFLPVVKGGTYGNFSMIHEGVMYITARGVDKGNLDIRHICRIHRIEKVEKTPQVFAGVYYAGPVKPSIDTAIIHAAYQLTAWQAIVHIHTDRQFAGLPLTGYNYPCGTKEEMEEIENVLKENPAVDIIQQYKHGLLVMGKDFQSCLDKIGNLFERGVSVEKIKEEEKEKKEFKEWESHYQRTNRGKNADIDIYDFNSLYLVYAGKNKVGLLYLRPKGKTLYFVFYSLQEFTKKGLGLGEKIIQLVSGMAGRSGYEKIGILTTRECDVYSYYKKKGFEKILEDDFGSIWMEKEVK